MLISKKHKFIFIHVPKVAGSSITKALRPYSNIPFERLYNYTFDFLGESPALGIYDMHISPNRLRENLRNSSFFDEAYKFAFVRNTWDWHVSQYHFHRQNKNYGKWHQTFVDKSFEEYVEWAIVPENMKRTLSTQKAFLSDPDGRLLVNFVGRFEELNADFDKLASKLNLPVQLPKANKSKRKKRYHEYYNERTRRLIRDAFSEDIEHFGFKF